MFEGPCYLFPVMNDDDNDDNDNDDEDDEDDDNDDCRKVICGLNDTSLLLNTSDKEYG